MTGILERDTWYRSGREVICATRITFNARVGNIGRMNKGKTLRAPNGYRDHLARVSVPTREERERERMEQSRSTRGSATEAPKDPFVY